MLRDTHSCTFTSSSYSQNVVQPWLYLPSSAIRHLSVAVRWFDPEGWQLGSLLCNQATSLLQPVNWVVRGGH